MTKPTFLSTGLTFCAYVMILTVSWFAQTRAQISAPEVIDYNETSILLEWMEVSGADNYTVQYIGMMDSVFLEKTAFTNSSLLTDLFPGDLYNISVTANQGNDTSGPSETIQQRTAVAPPLNFLAPTAFVEERSFKVTWVTPNGVVGGFALTCQIMDEGGGYETCSTQSDVTVDRNSTEFTYEQSIVTGAFYKITIVTTLNGADNSSSEFTILQTDLLPPTGIAIYNDQVATTSLNVTWNAPDNSRITGYNVTVVAESSNHATYETASDNFIILSDLTPGETYNITVHSVSGTKISESGDSIRQSTVPEVPENLNITAFGTDFIELDWDRPSTGLAVVYNVTYTSSDADNVMVISVEDTNATLSDLMPGDTYAITVQTGGVEKHLSCSLK